MRSLRLLALVAPALLLPVACEDSGSSSGGTFNPEAGPGFEAGPAPEAGPLPEAGIDSSTPPGPAGISVTVTDGVSPLKDVRIILHDAAGAASGDKKTDAAGKASFAIAQPMVTVLAQSQGTVPAPVTFMGVADGDKLVVVVPTNLVVEQVPLATYDVKWNLVVIADAAQSFDAIAGQGCSGSANAPATNMPVDLFPACVGPKNAVLAAARNGQLLGWAFAKDLPTPAKGTTVDVGPLAFAAFGSTSMTATNVAVGNAGPNTELYAIANGATFPMGSPTTGSLTDPAGAGYQTPTGFAEAYQAAVYQSSSNQAGLLNRGFLRREAPPANDMLTNFDFATALPAISSVAVTMPTAGRPDVVVTSKDPLTASDGAIVTLDWFPPGLDARSTWTFVLPSSATTFKAPALPADASAFVPQDVPSLGSAIFFEATQLPGYTDVKTLPVSTGFTPLDVLDTQRPLPAAGTVRISRFSNFGI
jgi:hypothetical protein